MQNLTDLEDLAARTTSLAGGYIRMAHRDGEMTLEHVQSAISYLRIAEKALVEQERLDAIERRVKYAA